MIIRPITTHYMESKCYLLIEGNHAIVVDPGDADAIIELANNEGITIDLGILTHEHCDHTYGCAEIRKEYSCDIYASKTCSQNLQNSKSNFSYYFNAFTEIQTKLKSEKLHKLKPFTDEANVVFENEMKVEWLNHEIYLHETPGHSPGSICIIVDDAFLLSGDTLLKDDSTGTNFKGGSEKLLLEETMPWLRSLPQNLIVYPGHGDSFVLGNRMKDYQK